MTTFATAGLVFAWLAFLAVASYREYIFWFMISRHRRFSQRDLDHLKTGMVALFVFAVVLTTSYVSSMPIW